MIARTAGLAAGLTLVLAHGAIAETERYNFDDFSEIEVSAGITLIVQTGDAFSVMAESPQRNGLRRLEIDLDGDILQISRETSWSGLSLFRAMPDITVTVSMPVIEALSVSSGAHASVAAARSDEFEAHVSSGAFARIEGLEAGWVDLHASSGADLRASGTCDRLEARASSGATVNAGDLQCDRVEADASSGASLRVYATEVIDAEASSGASVRVGGSAGQREERESSGGSVVFR